MILITGLGNPGEKFKKTRHNVGFQVLDEFAKRNDFPDFRFSRKFNSLLSEGFLDEKKIILAKPQTFMNESGKAIKSLVSSFKPQASRVWVIHDDIDLPLGKIRIAISRGAAGHRGIESIIKELGTKNFIRFRIGICPKTGKPKNLEKFVLQKPSEAKPSEGEDEGKPERGKLHRRPSEAKPSEGEDEGKPERGKLHRRPSEAGFAELRSSLALRFARADETKYQRTFNKGEEKIIKSAIKKTIEAIETTLKQGLEKAMNEYNK